MEAFDNAVSYWEDTMDLRVVQDIEEEDSRDNTSRVSLGCNPARSYSVFSIFCGILFSNEM